MEPQVLPQGINPEYVVLVGGVYYDLCVGARCGVNTSVRTDFPIEQRTYYVEGCGQLCKDCWYKIDSRA